MSNDPSTPSPTRQPIALTLVGLSLALVLPEIIVLAAPHLKGLFFAIRELIFWILTLVVFLYVRAVEKRPLSSIGLRSPTWRTWVWGLCAAVVALIGIGLIYGVVFRLFHLTMNMHAMNQLLALPRPVRFLVVLRAAIFEETLYRGYAIERLTELTGNRWAAALISLFAFTIAHISYWGAAQLLIAGFGGLVLTALYLWRRDLPCNMFTHFVTDGVGFLLR